jgi:hypothetical protein
MDFQTSIVDGFVSDKDALLSRTASLIEDARKAGTRVAYVVVGFRPGYPEVSPATRASAPSALPLPRKLSRDRGPPGGRAEAQ